MRKILIYFFSLFSLLVSNHIALANGSSAGDDRAYLMGDAKKDVTASSLKKARAAELLARRKRAAGISGLGGHQFVAYPGSLKANIERLASQYGWPTLKWTARTDFNWVATPSGTRIRANGLQGVLLVMLKDYPLQAQFYLGNHVLVIAPRTLK